MNAYLNYIIEANIGLVLFLACYKLLLKRETNFGMLRLVLLCGILASLIFPLIHLEGGQDTSPLSIGQVIPSYWLPEVAIGGADDAVKEAPEPLLYFWKYATLIYAAGFFMICALVLWQLSQLFRIIRQSKTYRLESLRIAESPEDKPTFSFFRFIFIGKADALSAQEKEQIIRHESVHARQWHSFDILLINLLKILFWFNPFINTYKKNFIQLHEFEADARAVENSDLNNYCSLLARVALQSADFTLANHFNNSLTVKRIEMMRTNKTNIKRWKLLAVVLTLPLVFFFISCQDQVGDDLMNIAKNSSHALIVPEEVQNRYDQLKKENPEKNYALLELNQEAAAKLEALRKQYGGARAVEIYAAQNGVVLNKPAAAKLELSGDQIYVEREVRRKDEQTFAILEFTEQVSNIAEASKEGTVYTVVEKQPEFTGGYDAMMKFIKENLRYPLEARKKGIEGTVYCSFIVETDGSVSEVKPIRGISPECDAEVVRVITLFPNWVPGQQNDQDVRVRFVLPIKFNL
jgi:TonB family protein